MSRLIFILHGHEKFFEMWSLPKLQFTKKIMKLSIQFQLQFAMWKWTFILMYNFVCNLIKPHTSIDFRYLKIVLMSWFETWIWNYSMPSWKRIYWIYYIHSMFEKSTLGGEKLISDFSSFFFIVVFNHSTCTRKNILN